jgi:streptogramin lyase
VLRIDPASAAVTARIEVESPFMVAVGPDAAWAATTTGIARIDLDDHVVTPITLPTAPADEGGVWADASSVWVRTPKEFLLRIDVATSTLAEILTDPDLGGGDILGLDGSLWTSDFVNDRVVHLRATP